MELSTILSKQRVFFSENHPFSLKFRLDTLKELHRLVRTNEQAIAAALRNDLHKSEAESFLAEIGIVLNEITFFLRNLKKLSRRTGVPTPLSLFPAKSYRIATSYGSVLIMAPWNYPFQLCMVPLIGAIAAGNTVILKPAADAPATSHLLAKMIGENFPPELIYVVEGGRAENSALLEQRFDYVFFTGSTHVGRAVMEACARNLTPLTLELGGKSPCIVDASADLKLAARRIVFGKLLNAGQTCIAPDFIIVDSAIKESLVQALIQAIETYLRDLGPGNFPRIINDHHFSRLEQLAAGEHIRWSGKNDPQTRTFMPMILDQVRWDAPVMTEEIFGPIFPVLTYESFDKMIAALAERPRPLALYIFSQERSHQQKALSALPFGSACVNDSVVQISNLHLPFGGVGESGMGRYHGEASFRTFSYDKSIFAGAQKIDFPFRYPPYSEKKLKFLKRFFK